MYFKAKYWTIGEHTHVRFYAKQKQNGTYSNLNKLTFRTAEWRAFRTLLQAGASNYHNIHIEFEDNNAES